MRFTPATPRTFRLAACVLGVVTILAISGHSFAQTPAPKGGPAGSGHESTSHANVHMAAGSGSELLLMVPKGTVLPILGRKGEWVQVRLTPELRKNSIVVRWYKNEDTGGCTTPPW